MDLGWDRLEKKRTNEQIYANRAMHHTVVYYTKLYLASLVILIYIIACLDGEGLPYMPIELSSLLISHYTRKAVFLASLAPVTLLLCFARPMRWSMRGMGISLFLMALFDLGNEWLLHLLAVGTFGLCLASNVKVGKLVCGQRILYTLVVPLYLLRVVGKLLYVWQWEMIDGGGASLIGRMKVLATLGCNGYSQCQAPLLTPYIFSFSAILQWLLFGLLVMLVNE